MKFIIDVMIIIIVI